jgi:hypothetical protein
MAKRSTPTPPPSVRLSPPQMRTAISRFRRRIDELQAFDPETVFSPEDPRVKILEVSIEEALAAAFGQGTPEYDRYSSAAFLNRVPIYMDRETPRGEIVHALVQSKERLLPCSTRRSDPSKKNLLNWRKRQALMILLRPPARPLRVTCSLSMAMTARQRSKLLD